MPSARAKRPDREQEGGGALDHAAYAILTADAEPGWSDTTRAWTAVSRKRSTTAGAIDPER